MDCIKYFRNPEIENMDDNIENAISKAIGKYVWILGDDDLIEADSLNYIIDLLKTDLPIYILNSQSFFNNNQVIEESRNIMRNDKMYDINDNDMFLEEQGGYITFISSIKKKKKLWDGVSDTLYNKTWFSHLAKLLIIKKNNKAMFVSKTLVKMRVFSQTWSKQHFEIWNILYPKTLWSLDGYSDTSKKKVINKNPLNSFIKILSSCAYGNYNFEIFNKLIKNNNNVIFFYKILWFLALPIPKKIFNFLYISIITLNLKKNSSSFSQKLALVQLRKK